MILVQKGQHAEIISPPLLREDKSGQNNNRRISSEKGRVFW